MPSDEAIAPRQRTALPGLAAGAAALLVGVPVTPGSPVVSLVVAAGAVLATAAAIASGSAPAIRTTLLADLVVAFALTGALVLNGTVLIWPMTVLLALGVGHLVNRRCRAPHPTGQWLRRGRTTRELPWLMAATVLLSTAALVTWARIVHPAPPPFVDGARDRSPLLLLAVIVGFAVVNGIAEEFLYRGFLLTELRTLLGTAPAVVLQAVVFGVAHLSGFPSGWPGAAMAAVWGIVLGVIRIRSEGILAAWVAHLIADSAIGAIGVFLLF
ncbi:MULTISPECIES: CPBP family intramembrane glutamic endopeptidase [Streptomyces]|uniref:CPBP family intramembrane glutamic endopeptidase n=1 Tax=Streptomyces TaxID=1883 RepID=UPI00345B77D4